MQTVERKAFQKKNRFRFPNKKNFLEEKRKSFQLEKSHLYSVKPLFSNISYTNNAIKKEKLDEFDTNFYQVNLAVNQP